LDVALNLIDFFWDFCVRQLYEIENRTPEKVAKWRKEIEEYVNDICDVEIRRLYKSELKERIFNILRPESQRDKSRARPVAIQKSMALSVNFAEKILQREALLLYTVMMRPSVAQMVIEDLSSIDFTDKSFKKIQEMILESPGDLLFLSDDGMLDDDTRQAKKRIEKIGKENCKIDEMDDERVLACWHRIYEVGFFKQRQEEDIHLAKASCKDGMNKNTWERLKELNLNLLNN
jgi:hypothetical protein